MASVRSVGERTRVVGNTTIQVSQICIAVKPMQLYYRNPGLAGRMESNPLRKRDGAHQAE
jgi:hypothetical protein